MEISRTEIDETPVIEVSGQIDLSNCYKIHDAINEEISVGNYDIIINLNRTSYIDSSCLGVLLGGLERLKKKDGSLAIVGNPLVDRILTLTGLTRVFPFHATVKDALGDIKKTKPKD